MTLKVCRTTYRQQRLTVCYCGFLRLYQSIWMCRHLWLLFYLSSHVALSHGLSPDLLRLEMGISNRLLLRNELIRDGSIY